VATRAVYPNVHAMAEQDAAERMRFASGPFRVMGVAITR